MSIANNKKKTLSFYIIVVVVLLLSLLGTAIYTGVNSRVETAMIDSQELNFHSQMNLIERSILEYLGVRKIVLSDYAKYPVIIQSVMQSSHHEGNVKDFISDLRILNAHYQTTLLDYRGNLIYEAPAVSDRDFTCVPWIDKLMSGEVDDYTFVCNDAHSWVTAVAVKYNGNPEGILLIQIPVSDVFTEKELIDLVQGGMSLTIYKDEEEILSYGKVTNGWEENIYIDEFGITLSAIFDLSPFQKELLRIQRSIIFIIALFTVIVMAVFVAISKQYIEKPLKEMECLMVSLSNPEDGDFIFNRQKVYEIDLAFKNFKDMAETIKLREKDLEEASIVMVQQEKLASIGQLAAGVAHELNTPIGFVKSNYDTFKETSQYILSYIRQLEENQIEGTVYDLPVTFDELQFMIEDIPEMIKESGEGYERIISIVENLRDFSREDNKERSEYDLNRGLETTLVVSRNEYKYVADVHVSYGRIPIIMAVGGEINEVLLNIILNAAHAIGEMDSGDLVNIFIKTYQEKEYVVCEISDEGPGIKAEYVNKIFDPFFTTKPPGKGTGLGLNIAYNIIVNHHKGQLTVGSTIGEGTTFKIKLPIRVEKM